MGRKDCLALLSLHIPQSRLCGWGPPRPESGLPANQHPWPPILGRRLSACHVLQPMEATQDPNWDLKDGDLDLLGGASCNLRHDSLLGASEAIFAAEFRTPICGLWERVSRDLSRNSSQQLTSFRANLR